MNSINQEWIRKDDNKGGGHRFKNIWRYIYPFLVIAVIWEAAVRINLISLASVPAPSTLIQEFIELAFIRFTLWQHLGSSLIRLAIGYSLAILIGTLIGALLSLNGALYALFEPTLSMLISVPTIAWVPILLITLGLGEKTVITAIFISAFFPVTYNTMRGVHTIPPSISNAARTMGLEGAALFLKVLLPASMPSIINGLRLALGYSWRALVGAELLAALIEKGMGKMVYQARFFNDPAVMMVGLILIGVSGYLLDQFFLVTVERNTIEKWGMSKRK